MFTAIAIILLAWFTEVPLWVATTCTILSCITIVIKLVQTFFEQLKNVIEQEHSENNKD